MKIVKVTDAPKYEPMITYGKYFLEEKQNGEWGDRQIDENIDRFYKGDWGVVSDRIRNINNKHLDEGKGNLTGIYPKGRHAHEGAMIVFYSERNDRLYVLNDADFSSVEKAWISGDEEYVNKYSEVPVHRNSSGSYSAEDPDSDYQASRIPSKYRYGEHGHQLKSEQKEFLRSQYPERESRQLPDELKAEYDELKALQKKGKLSRDGLMRLKELEEMIHQIKAENEITSEITESIHYPPTAASRGTVTNSEIEATRKAIETGETARGGKTNLPENAKQILEEIARSHNVDYIDVVEKVAEETQISRSNLKTSFEHVVKNADKPYFFADSKKPEWLDEEFIEDIIYEVEWPTTLDVIADILVKKGIERKEDAISYIKEYLNDNPDDKKHFKEEEEIKEILKQDSKDDDSPLRVCKRCLMGIESHEGPQFTKHVWVDEDDPEDSKCEWCEEDGFDELYEILGKVPTEDSCKKDSEEDFTVRTAQGYDVVKIFENADGRLYVIGYRPARKDYFVGAGYDTTSGSWRQGYYDYKSEGDAMKFLFDRYGDEALDWIR